MSKYVEVGLCNVVKGWAGSCVIIIEKLRKRAYKSQMIPVGLMVDCTCAMTAVLLSANIALRGRQVTRRRAGQQSTPFNSMVCPPAHEFTDPSRAGAGTSLEIIAIRCGRA